MTLDDLANCDSFTFDVTQEDIRAGRPKSSRFCAIALAINRTLGLPTRSTLVRGPRHLANAIDISSDYTQGVYSKKSLVFNHSPESVDFIKRFDNNKDVQPITITLSRST